MRIAINTRFLIKDKLEGIGRFSYELARQLVKDHPEDEFLFLFDRPFDPSFVFADNVKPLVLSPPARHPFLWYYWFEKAIPKALLKYKADVFLSPDGYLSLSTTVKTIMVTHDIAHVHYPEALPFLVRRYYNYFVPKFLKRADRIVTVSDFVKKDIQKTYKIAPQKIRVACNSCGPEFKALNESEKLSVKSKFTAGKDYFIYTGAIHPRKNVDALIKAFDLFKQNTGADDMLVLAGRMAWKTGDVQRAIEQSPFKKDILLMGFVEQETLPKLIAVAKAMVLVSKHEGFGIPLLEAMQSKVPIICSDGTALAEVAGAAALKVNPEDIDAISQAMKRIWSEPELSSKLVRKGLEQRKKFSWEKAVEVVYDQLNDLNE